MKHDRSIPYDDINKSCVTDELFTSSTAAAAARIAATTHIEIIITVNHKIVAITFIVTIIDAAIKYDD